MASSLDVLSAEEQKEFWRKFPFDQPSETPEGNWRTYRTRVPCKRCGEWAAKYCLWWTQDELHLTECFSHYDSENKLWHFCREVTDLPQSSAVAESSGWSAKAGWYETAVAASDWYQKAKWYKKGSGSSWLADGYEKPASNKRNARRGNMRKRGE